ncbi:MAG: trypsin-like peptidase domain-containing protein [Candidatus Microsaccharimonas sp.]
MVGKKTGHRKATVRKQVKLRAYHAKPYRKRHVGLVIASIVALVLLAIFVIQYRDRLISGFASSNSFVSDLFNQDKAYDVKVSSSYGFNLSYDQRAFYASAVEGTTGDLYLGTELNKERGYNIIRIAPNFTSEDSTDGTAFTFTFHPGTASANDPLEAIALQDGGLDAANLSKLSFDTVKVGGQDFIRSVWESKASGALPSNINARFLTYTGLVQNHAVTIVISLGIGTTDEAFFEKVTSSITFGDTVGYIAAPSNEVATKINESRNLLDVITGSQLASAATETSTVGSSEKIAALYAPAVAKIYHAYCMDITIDSKLYLKDACSASSGSGFFVSQDGYIATNGHVASVTPKDLVIRDAFSYYASKGDPQYVNYLISLTTLKASDIPADATQEQALGIMIDAMYNISDARIKATNDIDNLLVVLSKAEVDATALLEATANREAYSEDNTVKATLKAADYRAIDGINGYKSSDVAIIKIDGTGYPITKIGSIQDLTQGANLSILGYPGNASDNGIVESTTAEATLTTGKVSAKKNASGSDKMLIETDATVGHGNSGGPAFEDDGLVVGIATYSIDASGAGDGTYNYIRDIKDLIDLADESGITLDANSQTQALWEQGIDYFYTSHYSKAVKNFEKVQALYPNHSKVAEFIAAAEKRIANGEDIQDFPLIPVIVGGIIVLIGAGVGVFLIVRHRKHHIIYNAGVAQGTVVPAVPGDPAQHVTVTPGSPPDVQNVTPVVPAPTPVEPAPEPISEPTSIPIADSPSEKESTTQPEATETPAKEAPATEPEASSDQGVTIEPTNTEPSAPETPVNPWFNSNDSDNNDTSK